MPSSSKATPAHPWWLQELESTLPLLATLVEAGEATRSSARTIRRVVRRGEMKGLLHGKKLLIPRDEIIAYLARRIGLAS